MSASHGIRVDPDPVDQGPLPGPTRFRILAVDDDPSVREVLVKTLSEAGHSVTTAADGLEGWMRFDREPFHVVITDVMMPGLDGLELLRRIRRSDPHREVVLITGFGDTRLVIEALRAGASNFIEKPFTPEGLLAQLEPSFHRCAMAEERLRLMAEVEALREREERDRRMAALGKLLAGLAHEIHNPLTFVKGNAELLEGFWREAADTVRKTLGTPGAVLEEMHKLLQDLRYGVERVEFMVDAVKTLGAPPPHRAESARLTDLMDTAFRIALAQKPQGVSAHLEPPPETWFVTVDRGDMEACLVNILVNAFEAAACGGRCVRFRAQGLPFATPHFSGFVDIIVEDDGPGIPQGIIDEVFTPFFTTKEGGTGLGLSIAYEAAKRNGAQVEIASEEGKGTVVTVRLPYHDSRAVA